LPFGANGQMQTLAQSGPQSKHQSVSQLYQILTDFAVLLLAHSAVTSQTASSEVIIEDLSYHTSTPETLFYNARKY